MICVLVCWLSSIRLISIWQQPNENALWDNETTWYSCSLDVRVFVSWVLLLAGFSCLSIALTVRIQQADIGWLFRRRVTKASHSCPMLRWAWTEAYLFVCLSQDVHEAMTWSLQPQFSFIRKRGRSEDMQLSSLRTEGQSRTFSSRCLWRKL